MIEVTLSNNRDAFILNDDIPQGVSFKMPEIPLQKSLDSDTAATILINIAAGIPSSLIAAWLYDKFKQCRSSQISINRREIHVTDGNVTKIIEEAINIKR